MRYRVRHTTTYTYDEDVTDSYGIAHVTPRELPWQRVGAHEVVVDPVATDLRATVDHFGNTRTYFQVDQRHRVLRVEARSDVEVLPEVRDGGADAQPWELCRPRHRVDVDDAWSARELALRSELVPHTPTAFAYARESLLPGRPIAEAALDLVHRIHRDFEYEQGATTVTSTIDDLFETRAGVCQDFAHLTLACLRSHGLAARYVSGYLATDPPPGRDRVVGADASHAWAAVWVPGGTWLAIDPTNDQCAGQRYVTTAWGRDYADVPPVKGVIYSEASTSLLDVEVDVAPV
ncbi:transglutaminase family protein [Aeromicrobium sp.]|uniref:transglutaminase family protein n=1 Tax=Aeromicrobium sp. TaxID=1871063 RepID=UPI0025BFB6BA|nr:transglutaminase family protein [Aeromicrobium sp.]MCK5890747.1 transglutaminase family protein [Aeromicrobium sp.]